MTAENLLDMVNISKNFSGIQALCGVNFSVGRGEVVGLVGDNGAGKTTLTKIILGWYPPDTGAVYFEGKETRFQSPKEAREAHIEPVYQDMAVIPYISVWRNFFMGREVQKKLGPLKILDEANMKIACTEFLANIGVHVSSPEQLMCMLSGGERQSVAIGRAMYHKAKLLILDEPTASLSVRETDKVLQYVKEAKAQGISSIFITHNLYHLCSVADKITILDRGNKIGDYQREETTAEELIRIISHAEKGKHGDVSRHHVDESAQNHSLSR